MALTKNNFYAPKPKFHKDAGVFEITSSKAIIEFSFDDGYKLDLKVADILDTYKIKGVFYIVLDNVGKSNEFLTWDNIKELEKRGHEIGSHTVSHPQDLKALYEPDLHYEIQNSKDMLEIALGHPISKFCYPRGRFDDRVKAMVDRAGYIYARTTGRTGVIPLDDPLEIPGSLHIFQRKEYYELSVLDYAKNKIDIVKEKGGYLNIWGHSREIDQNNLWETFESICKYVVAQNE